MNRWSYITRVYPKPQVEAKCPVCNWYRFVGNSEIYCEHLQKQINQRDIDFSDNHIELGQRWRDRRSGPGILPNIVAIISVTNTTVLIGTDWSVNGNLNERWMIDVFRQTFEFVI